MNIGSVLLWGFLATIVLTTIMFASQAMGLSRMSIPYMLGTMVTAQRDRAKVLGFMLHLINGWTFAIIYASAFESVRTANWWLGAIFGFIHAFFVLVVAMQLLPGMHPRMASEDQGPSPTRHLEPPGFMALNYGWGTPIVTLVTHCIYGAILGNFYQLA